MLALNNDNGGYTLQTQIKTFTHACPGILAMRIALIADPHVSLTDRPHTNIRLIDTLAITAAVVDDVEHAKPDLVIWMGDLTHEGSPEVRAAFKQLASRLTVPSLWMMGNHDVERISKSAFAQAIGPCVRRMLMQVAGWNLVILDTVPELTPHNPLAHWSPADTHFLRDAVQEAAGPMLVIAHHPPRSRYMSMQHLWQTLAGFKGTGVFIGGHSHRDMYTHEQGWHLVDVSSCCREPFGYHLLELSPQALTITAMPVKATTTGPLPTHWQPDEPVFPLHIPTSCASIDKTGEERN